MSVKLNIGAGSTVIDGFTPIDRKLGSEAFPLQYADGSVDEIRASHILEHFTFRDVAKALDEWVRVLRPGGLIRIAVPDVQRIAAEMATSDVDETWRFHLMGGQTDGDDFHRSAFTRASLSKHMLAAGLRDIRGWESANTDTAAHPVSLNLEGIKPVLAPVVVQDVKVKAYLTLPRYWATCSRDIIEASIRPFGLSLNTRSGVFWHQHIQQMFEEACEQGIDWILSFDADTMCTRHDVDRMFGTLGDNPHIDALAALQCRREGDTPLMTIKGKTEYQVGGEPIKVNTAHFGLTLIRVEALKGMPKPWLMSVPDEHGGWGDGRLDADIYFWDRWAKAGNSLYVTPNVRIGHAEECVSYFDEHMQPQRCSVKEWRGRFLK